MPLQIYRADGTPKTGLGSVPRVTVLPATPVDGQEVYWEPSLAGTVGAITAPVWHMRRNAALNKWEFIGGSPMAFRMEGENAAYVVFSNGSNITVNAALTKLLQVAYNLPVDTWCDVSFSVGNVVKMDAAYHWVQFITMLAGFSGAQQAAIRTQHTSVQTNEPYLIRGLFGGSAGVNAQAYLQASVQGGSWQHSQVPMFLSVNARVWPR